MCVVGTTSAQDPSRRTTGIDHEDKSSSDSADEGARLKGLEEK